MSVSTGEASAAGFLIPPDDLPIADIPATFRNHAQNAAVGAWRDVTNQTYRLTPDGTAPYGTGIKARKTPLGIQMRGKVLIDAQINMDEVLFTVPVNHRPATRVRMFAAGMGSGTAGYAALAYQVEIRETGEVTARQNMAAGGRVSFDFIFPTYDD